MKYAYFVSFAIPERGCHTVQFGDAPAAIDAARLAYAALQCVLEPSRDALPSFAEIRKTECMRIKSEPRNKSFTVDIRKSTR